MSERLTTEHLRIEYRDDPDLLALMDEYEVLRARVEGSYAGCFILGGVFGTGLHKFLEG